MQTLFNRTYAARNEELYIRQALANRHLSGDGPFTKACQRLLEKRFNADLMLLTTSCTSALEMAALLCDVGPGDEVILPSFTFTSTANAFLLRNATLKFVDVRPDTLNIDVSEVAAAITDKTKVIVPVHYAGVGCEMGPIMQLADKQGIAVVEDAAQGVDARYQGKYLGTWGHLGTYSFHETKNFVSGEGGAIVINDSKYAERAEIIREKGTNRNQFFRGQVDKYSWVDIGSSFLPSDILAALLLSQLEEIDEITAMRRAAYRAYYEALQPLADRGLLQLPHIPTDCDSNYHAFVIRVADGETRDSALQYLREAGAQALFHYVPLHTAPVGLSLGYRAGMLPVTEAHSARLIRMPLYAGLDADRARDIAGLMASFFGNTSTALPEGRNAR